MRCSLSFSHRAINANAVQPTCRELREQHGLNQKELAQHLVVSPNYVNKVENEWLQFGDYPSAKFIHKLADGLNGDEDEFLLLADKVTDRLRKRIRERLEIFIAVADLDDKAMDQLMKQISQKKVVERG